MKTISIINLKGGVGKTFTSYNMAYELGKRGYRVLVLDNDKQGNISKALGKYSADGESPAALLLSQSFKNAQQIISKTEQTNIDIVSSNMSLMAAVWKLAADNTETQLYRYTGLKEMAQENYDYLIIDNPPDIALNVINALQITDEVIVPVKIDEWALEGLDIIAEQINEAKEINKNIKLLGALVTMYRNDDANIAGLEWLEKKSPVKMLAKIRYTVKATESTFFGKPAYEYSPRCGAAQDYKKFVTAYLSSQKGGI